MDTLEAIIKHGLSVRQIPMQVVSLMEMRHHNEGEEIVEEEMTKYGFAWYKKNAIDSTNWRFDEAAQRVWRRFARKVRVPTDAGCWMCRTTPGTGSMIEWNTKRHNLAPTLQESVALFLAGPKNKDESS